MRKLIDPNSGFFKARINELRLDAGISRLHDEPKFMVALSEEGTVLEPLDGLEKFAELIVRECIAICQDIDGEDNIDARLGRQDCAVEIREHFGQRWVRMMVPVGVKI